MKEYLQK